MLPSSKRSDAAGGGAPALACMTKATPLLVVVGLWLAGRRRFASIAAVTLVLWTPVAWWLAQKSTKTPLVGPITIKPAAAAAAAPEAEKAAEPASGSGH